MYTAFFEAIQSIVSDRLPSIKKVDYFNNQYENTEEQNPTNYPALYVEFGKMTWDDISKKVKHADTTITLHLATTSIKASPSECLLLAAEIQDVFQGISLKNETGDFISNSFTLEETDLVNDYDQIKVFTLGYQTTLIHYPNSNKTKTKTAQLEVVE